MSLSGQVRKSRRVGGQCWSFEAQRSGHGRRTSWHGWHRWHRWQSLAKLTLLSSARSSISGAAAGMANGAGGTARRWHMWQSWHSWHTWHIWHSCRNLQSWHRRHSCKIWQRDGTSAVMTCPFPFMVYTVYSTRRSNPVPAPLTSSR